MSITYQCKGCGSWQTARDGLAGKSAKCPDCREPNLIPAVSAEANLYDPQFDGRPAKAQATASAPPRTSWGPAPTPTSESTPQPAKKSGGGWSGTWSILGFVAILALRFYMRPQQQQPRPVPVRGANQQIQRLLQPILFADPRAAIALPPLPDLPPGREIEPGVTLHELRLGNKDAPAANPPNPRTHRPGFATRIWVYLPSPKDGKAPTPKSLPCVLIAPAGSNLIMGMPLMKDDRPEHIPYVKAGFAVVAFDLEGYPAPGPGPAGRRTEISHVMQFLQARAGLVNAHVALEYALAKVPAVDPSRLYSAGHSSAGTLAMLFAESEPRLKGCLAYAPAIDLSRRLDPRAAAMLRGPTADAFFARYSPNSLESQLSQPLFLFAARDDELPSLDDAEACARRLKGLGKDVTLEVVDTGGHYESMVNVGIPRGIAWIKALESKPKAEPPKP